MSQMSYFLLKNPLETYVDLRAKQVGARQIGAQVGSGARLVTRVNAEISTCCSLNPLSRLATDNAQLSHCPDCGPSSTA